MHKPDIIVQKMSVASPSGSRQGNLEALKAAARAADRGRADGASPGPGAGGPLPITPSRIRMRHLVDALEHAYRVPGLAGAATSAKHSKPSSATAEVRTSLSQLRMVRKSPHG
jgi:hypothetical protein